MVTEPTPGVQRDIMDGAARQHLYPFALMMMPVVLSDRPYIANNHVEALCVQLEAAFTGGPRSLLVNMPPRYLKSITVSVLFCAWLIGRDPSFKIIVATYGATLSEDHSRLFRRVVRSPFYRRLFPKVRWAVDTVENMVTTRGGGRRNTSLGSGITGVGADLLIVDDLIGTQDIHSEARRAEQKRYVDETLYSRLDNKENAVFIVVQQRLHEDDVIQHLYEKGSWHLFSLPAIATEPQSFPLMNGRSFNRAQGDVLAPLFESRETLAEIERGMTSRIFSAQYQQNPIPDGGDVIKIDWFERVEGLYDREEYEYVVQSWDTASSIEPGSAFSVCMTLGLLERHWEILDIWRERVSMPDLVRAAERLYKKWVPNKLLIENKSSGIGLIQMLRNDPRFTGRRTINAINPGIATEDRMISYSPLLEQGLILIPDEAKWLAAFTHECTAFPKGRYMDQIDALSQFLEWTSTREAKNIVTPPAKRVWPDPYKRTTNSPFGTLDTALWRF
ncbi:phage terminase large subunit [Sphingobium subterraneum]|uniref:Putative phage terminase large subunit-like protein n=1 Tax=Sphingobium subterraneum TaxID=627688 RepID=A0A841J2L6_9SPHN|nr:phage terminase large subunit [Sphingobium subterraneum]MBB6124592.1 putative phage terminase large subunit-like protein [Sphingobium subterraneum]